MIRYISTRGGGNPLNFEDVLMAGLAPDGGLYVPEKFPQINLPALKGKFYNDIAEAVMYPFVEGSITREDFRRMIDETYCAPAFTHPDITPLIKLKNNLYVLELFHGPTIAFKDIALQLLGRLFDHVLRKRDQHITIIGATSGDTGSAAIEGCRHTARASIFILHPEGRVSDVQRRQMTTVIAPNVHNIAVQGSFDDCQALVKAMFNDAPFRAKMNLTAVNSINWARIMAQIVYYVYVATQIKNPSFVVPTGNFGNVYAAYCARKMGVPIKTLAIATNRNDILTRFFESGEMRPDVVVPSLSPSMDIQISSNFERYLFDLLGRDAKKLSAVMDEFKKTGRFAIDESLMKKARSEFIAFRANDDETLAVIKNCFEEFGYLLDPHSAVGMKAALELEAEQGGSIVTLACAHPAKFPAAVSRAISRIPPLPGHLSDLLEKPEKMTILPNNLKLLQDFIVKPS